MKLPNRTGTICRLSGKRRKPYMVRVYTASGYAILGYYRLRSEAMTALMAATQHAPNPPQSPQATLSEVYAIWSAKHYQTINAGSIKQYEQAWRVLTSIHNRPIRLLTVSAIESAVSTAHAAPSVQNTTKTLLNQLYATALRYELVDKDIAAFLDINVTVPKKVHRKVFTFPEVSEMFDRRTNIDCAILVAIYTGMRPCEVISLNRSEIDLESNCFRITGSKTESGYNRTIPIHPAILSIVQELAAKPSKSVFRTNYNKPLTYGAYKYAMEKIAHTPHDTRHTFATYAKKSKLDPLAVKRIMGHRIDDLTEAVYTHLDLPYLTAEMHRFAIL